MNAIKAAAVIAVVIVAFGIVGQQDYEEEIRQTAYYCDMVKLYEQTNGQSGWPAYNGKGMCQ